MKKFLILVIVSLFVNTLVIAQETKFGIRFAPNLALNAVKGDNIEKNGIGARFGAGIFADFPLKDNVYFSTGLNFTSKRIDVKTDSDLKSVYNLQYIQLPLSIKFYTNEVADKMKIYFSVGGTLETKIAEKAKKDDFPLKANAESQDKPLFFFLDAGMLLGAGVEYQAGTSTALFAGLSYNRSLLNNINPTLKDKDGKKIASDVRLSTSLISLDLGVKF